LSHQERKKDVHLVHHLNYNKRIIYRKLLKSTQLLKIMKKMKMT